MTSKEKTNIIRYIDQYCIMYGKSEQNLIDYIKSLPIDDTPTIRQVREYNKSNPIDCEEYNNCTECPRLDLCNNLPDTYAWDIDKITNIINKDGE